MKTSDAVAHFGTKQAIADALGVCKQAVSHWGETVPPRRAYELERLTGEALKADTGLVTLNANRRAESGKQEPTHVTKQG